MNSVNILGLTYKVNEVEVVSKEELRAGEINFLTQEIKIDKTLSVEKKNIALLHEVIHGICDQLHFEELSNNEQMVQGIAVALHQILKDGLPIFS